jgi:hypothetical protein
MEDLKELIKAINKLKELFEKMTAFFGELDKVVENKDVDGVNNVVKNIKELTKSIASVEEERMKFTKALCDKYKIKENAKVLANTLQNKELTESLNSLVDSINKLIIKRDYTVNILQSNIDYINFSIDYFKKLLSFGNYNEKGEANKFINLLDQEA